MFEDHEPVNISQFMGLWDRGLSFEKGDNAPIDHAVTASNIRFNFDGWEPRAGFNNYIGDVGGGLGSDFARIHVYNKLSGVIHLGYSPTAGLVNLNSNTVLHAPVVGATDITVITLFDRAYISFHDGKQGISGAFLLVYDGTTARLAGGSAPAGTITVVNGAAGKIEKGEHVFAVAFETASGFITKAGAHVTLSATGGLQANLSTIPIGPAGTLARHILASKRAYTGWTAGNFADLELFFVPNGKIADNVTTTYVANFYDADLVASADYLLDEKEAIEDGSILVEYDGRLVVAGFPGVNESLVRVSRKGEPESFAAIDGFFLVRPGDGGQVTNITPFRDSLSVHKEFRTTLVRDNGQAPPKWDIDSVDNNIGTWLDGTSRVANVQGPHIDRYLLLSYNGIEIFNGAYQERPLTWKIERLWKTLSKGNLYKAQILEDPIAKLIYVNFPDIGGGTSYTLIGDYNLGLNPDRIRWMTWSLAQSPGGIDNPIKSIYLVVEADKTVRFRIFSSDTIYEYSGYTTNYRIVRDQLTGVGDQTFQWTYTTVLFGKNDRGSIVHFGGIRIRMGINDLNPVGTQKVTISHSGAVYKNYVPPAATEFTYTTGNPLFRRQYTDFELNFVNIRMSLSFSNLDNSAVLYRTDFFMRELIIFQKLEDDGQP